MKIRFEVARGRSFYWSYFVTRARKHSSYAVTTEGLVEIHSVEASSAEEAIDLWQVTRSWKGLTVYVDGKIMSSSDFNFAMARLLRTPSRTSQMLRGIIDKSAEKRDRADADRRRRMGLDDGPQS